MSNIRNPDRWRSDNSQVCIITELRDAWAYRIYWWDKSKVDWAYSHADHISEYNKPSWDVVGRVALAHHRRLSAMYLLTEYTGWGMTRECLGLNDA